MRWFIILTGCVLIACTQDQQKNVDIQGHRGARGLAPENSIPAFILATSLGVNTLEMDLVVSKDGQLVVSHEPYFSPDFCQHKDGSAIPEDSVINIYQLTYDEITTFDCGIKENPKFPNQKKISTSKPLLADVIDSVESFVNSGGLKKVFYNIELKTSINTDSVFHPNPEVFSDLTYKLLDEKDILNRVTIQSFDFRTLQYFHKQYPGVKLALLIANEMPWKSNIDSLGFVPEIYSPYYLLLSQENVTELQEVGMKVIPWTVNEMKDIKDVLALGVDGIITDYPNRAVEIIKE
jgi:glycerophosphoryl diester phosphodiesterase